MTDSDHILSKIRLFRDLPHQALLDLERKCDWLSYRTGEQIIGESDSDRNVYFIAHGTVSVLVFSSEGRQIVFRELGEGQQFGEFAALDGKPRSASVIARTDCRLARLSAQEFRELAHAYPVVMESLLRELTTLVRQLSDRVFEFSTLAVNSRVQAELLRLARTSEIKDNRAVIRDPPTHEQIAARVSTHREAVSRELSALMRQGIIERRGKAVVVCDVQALSGLLQDTIGPPIRTGDLC